MPVRISKEKEEYIKNNYLIESTKSILQKLNISKPCLLRYARKYNLKIKSSKLYNCDENFFEKIDTEEKAYWLGFLYADGYVRVRKGGSEVRLKLSIKDVDHVKKFNDAVKSNNEIKIKGKFAISSVNQRKFVKHLVDKGCINKKSLIIKFPYFLEENLKKHFIRGYFDGDGSVSISFKKNDKYKRKMLNVNFVSGSFDMLKSIGEIISFGCNVKIPEIYNYK